MQALKNSSHSQVEIPKIAPTLCERTEKIRDIAHTLYDAAKVMKRGGVIRSLYAGASTVAGPAVATYGYFTNNPELMKTGAAITVGGALSLYELVRTVNKENSQLAELLCNAGATRDMLTVLVDADQASFSVIKTNLSGIKTSVESLNTRMGEIKDLASGTHSEIDLLKEKAMSQLSRANLLYKASEKFFSNGQAEIQKANQILVAAFQGFQEIAQLAQSQEGSVEERLAHFAAKAEALSIECMKGMVALDKGNRCISQGLKKMHEAHQLQESGAYEAGQAVAKASSAMQEVALKAQKEEACLEKIEAIEQETETLQARNEDKKSLLEVLKDKYHQMTEALPTDLTASNVFGFAGAGAGTALTPAVALVLPFGVGAAFVAPVAAGFAVKTAVRNRQKIGNKVYNLLFGKPREKVPGDFAPIEHQKTNGIIRYAFDTVSTGWRKWFDGQRRGSKTEGDVQIDLGSEVTFNCRFHMGKDQVVGETDLLRLQEEIVKALSAKRLSKEACLNLLTALATPQERLGNRALVEKHNVAFFGEIRRRCHA